MSMPKDGAPERNVARLVLLVTGLALVLGATVLLMDPEHQEPVESGELVRDRVEAESVTPARRQETDLSSPRTSAALDDSLPTDTGSDRSTSAESDGDLEDTDDSRSEDEVLDAIVRMSVEELAASDLLNPYGVELSEVEKAWLQSLVDQNMTHVNAVWGQRTKRSVEIFRELRDRGASETVAGPPVGGHPAPSAPGQQTAYSFKDGVLAAVRIDRGTYPDFDRLIDAEKQTKRQFFDEISAFFQVPFDPGPSPIQPEQRNTGMIIR